MATTFDISSLVLRRAVLAIERRAERQIYDERLTRSYVPTRAVEDLNTTQNQLLYGRRGVGKTHTLKYYLSDRIQEGQLCHYIDCTSFGSGLAADGSPLNIGIRFFSKFLSTLAADLLDDVLRLEPPVEANVDRLVDLLARLDGLSQPSQDGSTFDYSSIIQVTNGVLDEIRSDRLILILDEWAQVPMSAQPYFAEFLKRAFFSNNRMTLKISVVDYMYRLSERHDGQHIGLEQAADIFSDIRMDRYFVWDEGEAVVEQFFAEVLYNHLATSLDLSLDTEATVKQDIVLSDLFTQVQVFSNLCRASEGNARDFLVIFAKALDEFSRQEGHQRIGLSDVYTASALWYRQDKQTSIASETHLEDFLGHLLNSVIRDRRARTFMIESGDMEHPLLRRMFAARILHPLNTVWSHPHRPGERFSLVTIDYGTYVSLKGTKGEPHDQVFWFEQDSIPNDVRDLVPLDDRRSIRRIIVSRDILDRYWPSA